MVGIGMLVGGVASPAPDLEATLVRASIEGMERHDLRVLAVLVTWFGVYAATVNADRLTRLVALQTSKRVRALWSALACPSNTGFHWELLTFSAGAASLAGLDFSGRSSPLSSQGSGRGAAS
jgi:hypothetical protein